MSLSTNIQLKVSDYTVTLSRNLKFYKDDQLKLVFEILYWGIDNANGVQQKTLMPLNALSAVLFLETPDGIDSVEAGNVENNVVTFYLDSTYTQNVGISRMQIRLFDEDGCAITLPEFPFEIKENIYGESTVNFSNVVLIDANNSAIVTEDLQQIDVGDTFLYGVEPVEPNNLVEINDLEEIIALNGSEYLLIQDNEGTKRVSIATLKTFINAQEEPTE